MRIWFISAYDMPGGQSSRTYDFALELAGLGHDVTIMTSSFNHFSREELLEKGEKFRDEMIGPIRVIWLKTFPYKTNGWQRGLNMLTNAWRAYWVGKKLDGNPDVIFGPSVPLFTALSAYLLARKRSSKFCFEVRDIWPQALIDLGQMREGSLAVRLFRKIEIFLYRNADHIITVLPFAHRHITKYDVDETKITWVPNGVNLRRFSDSDYDGGDRDSITVMYIGGFAATHGIDTIIQAAQHFDERKVENIRFVLIGGGRNRDALGKSIGTLAPRNLEFEPLIPKSEVAAKQEQADILIASVKDTPVYQFGINSNKIFDYLASGRPIIFAGNTPNDPILDANAGISIPPEDVDAMIAAIRTLVEMSPAERAELGRNGRDYAKEHFDTRKLAKQLENVLLGLIESPGDT